MDQIKDLLRQAIKHRFWIAVGVSALLPMIAYLVGSGPIRDAAAKETDSIKAADGAVKKYMNGVLPNGQYKPIVEKEKDDLARNVHASWKKLYARQSPLLTWPKSVEERFQAWGRKWPENVDASAVQLAIIDYVTAYPKYVSDVYATFKPFDPVEGTGVVAAPPEASLLRPSQFTIENPPELGKVWAAQERLWIQGTLLRVIDEVNRDAKNWDSAIIRQVNALEVGNALAQDQVSLANGDTLVEPEAIAPPGGAAAGPPPAAPGGPGGMPGAPGLMPEQRQDDPEAVYYIKTDSTQYKTLPVQLTVLIEQDHIQDLLTALENSPMAIEVVDFEMSKPAERVLKPQKGEQMNYAGAGGANMMDMMRMYNRAGGGRMGAAPGMPPMAAFGGGMNMMRMYGMMGGPGAMPNRAATGVDKRSAASRAERKKEELEKASKTEAVTIHDQYYYIVEVTVRGKARFYEPPPPDAPAEPSQAAEAPAGEPARDGATPAAAAAPEAPKADDPKTETPKDAAKADAPGPDAAKKTEAPKADDPKTETPRADAPPDKPAGAAPGT